MLKVAHAGEDHRHAARVGGGDDVGVLHGASRLDGAGRAGVGRGEQAVREGEEGVGGDGRALQRELGFAGLPDRDAGRVDAGHLAGAHAERAFLAGVDDGVGLHVADDAPAEEHRGHLVGGGRALGHDLEVAGVDGLLVAVLDEHAADDGADFAEGVGAEADLGAHEAEILLLAEDREGVGVELRRDDDLGEDLGDGLGEALVDGAVGDDDAAERGLLVGLEGLVPGFEEGVGRSHAAGVGVLQDADRRALELADEVGRGGDIEDVIIAELLALELLERLVERAVERGLLVRVLAVAEALGDRQGGREAGGQAEDVAGAGLGLGLEVVGDRGVVGGGALEDLEGEFAAEFAEGLGGLHRGEHALIVGGVGDDGDGGVVLGRAAEHGRAADVDVLDGVLEGAVGLRDGSFERVEVHDDEVDEVDAVLLGFVEVLVRIATAEEAAVDLRVEGLHAAFHDLGEARMLADVGHRQAGVAQHLRGAAGGEELVTVFLDEGLGEGQEAGLVADGEKGDRHGERKG